MLDLLIRFIWFIFIGWWLGQIAILVAWFFMLTIIGIPVGLLIINRLPEIITLRPPRGEWGFGGAFIPRPQLPFLMRAIWFVLIGWWLSLIWLEVAYILMLPIITIPISFFMFSKAAFITTLRV